MIKTARSKTELPLEEGEDSSPLVEWGCGISKRYLKRIESIEQSLCKSIAAYENACKISSSSADIDECPICCEVTGVDMRAYFECGHWACLVCGDKLKQSRATCHMCRAPAAIVENPKYGIWATAYIQNDETCHVYTFGRERCVHSFTNVTHISHSELESFLQELLEGGGKLIITDAFTFHRWLRQLNIRIFDRQELMINTFNL
jgi:hypothetical protein